jgi:hypothetical protein
MSSSDDFYHETNVSRNLAGADAKCVMQELSKNPTPGAPSAASPGGTSNNAKVWPFPNNPVKSYQTTSVDSSNIPVVVNTAGVGDGSVFGPGYVARYVQGGRVYTRGEGTSGWQSFGSASDFMNEQIWGEQLDRIVEKCKCR